MRVFVRKPNSELGILGKKKVSALNNPAKGRNSHINLKKGEEREEMVRRVLKERGKTLSRGVGTR